MLDADGQKLGNRENFGATPPGIAVYLDEKQPTGRTLTYRGTNVLEAFRAWLGTEPR